MPEFVAAASLDHPVRGRCVRRRAVPLVLLLILLQLVASAVAPVSAKASSAGSAIVAAARGQAGYKTNPYGTNCNKFSASWGSRSASCGSTGNRSVAWCADFAAWAWAQAGITGLYGHGINANASSFRTWGQATGRWHPLGDGYAPQPGDVAEYSDAHVGIYTGGPAGSPTVINGNWWYPDRGTGQVYEQANESSNDDGANLSGYTAAPDVGTGTSTAGPGSPTGNLDAARGEAGGSISVTGWTVDPDAKTVPTQVHVYTDGPAGSGTFRGASTAGLLRQDVANVHSDYGPTHGFSFAVAGLNPGSHTVYVYAINAAGSGDNPLIGQATVTVPDDVGGRPFGSFDVANGSVNGSVTLRGWTVDPDVRTKSTDVHFYLNASAGSPSAFYHAVTASVSRPDVAAAVSGAGNNHGFDITYGGLTPGATYTVYGYAINAAGGGDNPLLGSRTFVVPGPSPIGNVEALGGDHGLIYVAGWVLDPTAPTSATSVHVYVGGPAGSGQSPTVISALAARPDVAAAFPGVSSDHGFSATIPASPGQYAVYVYGIDLTGNDNDLIGSSIVTVPGVGQEDVIGHFDQALATTSGTSGAVRIRGWAFDQSSPTALTDVHAYLDGPSGNGTFMSAIHAGISRPDVAKAYPAAGPNHGFDVTLTGLALGSTHTVFIHGIDVSGGQGNPILGSLTFTVPMSVPVRFTSIPASAVAGSAVHITGFGTPGRVLELLYAPSGAGERVARAATANASGVVSYSVNPISTGSWRLRERGTAIVSAQKSVAIASKVTMTATRVGTRRYTFKIQGYPARTFRFTLYAARSGGSLVRLGTATTNSAGRGSIAHTFVASGRQVLFARSTGDSKNAVGSSARHTYSIS